jgi:hypothetical protein
MRRQSNSRAIIAVALNLCLVAVVGVIFASSFAPLFA